MYIAFEKELKKERERNEESPTEMEQRIAKLKDEEREALDRLMQSTYWKDDRPKKDKVELGVVLMDQEMPVMDGLTCTRRIRELEAEGKLTGHVPIIAVTANARPEQVQTALDAGMVSIKFSILT